MTVSVTHVLLYNVRLYITLALHNDRYLILTRLLTYLLYCSELYSL